MTEVISMYHHEGSRKNLPRPLIDYSEGVTMGLPVGKWDSHDLWKAKSLRRTFFRRLQRERPGLQWRWDDYYSLMRDEIVRYAKRALTKPILERWDEIRQRIPRLFELYLWRLRSQFKVPEHELVESDLPRAAVLRMRKAAILEGCADPRILGAMEELLFERAFYGMPSRVY